MKIKISEYPKAIKAMRDIKEVAEYKKIKIGLLSSYTIDNIKIPLEYHLLHNNFNPKIKIGGYNQINQDLIDESSWLYNFNPDIIAIALSTETLFRGVEHRFNKDSFTEILNNCKKKVTSIIDSIDAYAKPAKIILTTLNYSTYSPFGLKDMQMKDGFFALIQKCNEIILDYANKNNRIILIDFDRFCKREGTKNITDDKLFYLGKIFLSNTSADRFSKEIVTCINASYGKIKKCMIVDLDNTLWGGVIGEDGVDGIKIGDSIVGNIYKDIQKVLLDIKRNGILLAIVSKNNKEDVMPVFTKKKGMVLKKDDFVTMRINWKTKSENIMDIADELNLGVESFVFLDDNPVERLEVGASIPGISIIEFPDDISKLPKVLKDMTYFSAINMTEEDKIRHKMYMQESKRNILKKKASIGDYLKELKIKISVKKDDIEHVERITQLTNKTNQFNLRTKRYTLEQVKEIMESKKDFVFSVHVSDQFGDMGLTGVIIFKEEAKKKYFVDTFLMSCRVLSRGIEAQFFTECFNQIKSQTEELRAEYIKTPKNSQTSGFYEKLGFLATKVSKDQKNYVLKVKGKTYKDVDWIEVV